MSTLLSECEPILRLLGSNSFTYLRKSILQKAKNNVFYCITEICYNLLKSTIVVNNLQQNWIRKNRPLISILANKKVPISRKRKCLLRTQPDFLPKLYDLIQGNYA